MSCGPQVMFFVVLQPSLTPPYLLPHCAGCADLWLDDQVDTGSNPTSAVSGCTVGGELIFLPGSHSVHL